MYNTILKSQKLPGYAELMTVEVSVQSILITEGNLQAQWSIDLPQSGPKLPGAPPPQSLFKGNFDMPTPASISTGLGQFFQSSAPGLVANLSAKADAAAKAEVDRLAAAATPAPMPPPAPAPAPTPVNPEPLTYPS